MITKAPEERLQTPGSRLQEAEERLQTPDSRLQEAEERLQTPGSRLQEAEERLQTPDFRLQEVVSANCEQYNHIRTAQPAGPGAWSLEPDACPSPGAWSLEPGACPGPGVWSLKPGACSRQQYNHIRTARTAGPGAWSLESGACSRRGLSLLEVLVSVFVLTLGLMGIIMTIPAGQVLMADASRADHATACGRAALNEVQVRRWYDPNPWDLKPEDLFQLPGAWLQKFNPGGAAVLRPALIANPPYPGSIRDVDSQSGLLYGETYFLDPRFFNEDTNSAIETVRHFPYSPNPNSEFALWGGSPRVWPDRARARRITFQQYFERDPTRLPTTYHAIPNALADQLATWADQLIFSLEGDTARPRRMYSWLNTATLTDPSEDAVYPVLGADLFDTTDKMVQHASNQGNLTWAAMITPIVPLVYSGIVSGRPQVDPKLIGLWDTDNNAATIDIPIVDPRRITRFEISIVVFHNRNFACPDAAALSSSPDLEAVRERSVYAQLIGDGIGGGDALLFVPDGDAARPPGYLRVKKDDWIMLKGLDRSRFVGVTSDSTLRTNRRCVPTLPTVCKWYRVVGVDEVEARTDFPNPANPATTLSGRQRYVTLAGPDWQVNTTAPNGPFDPDTDIAEAALVDDVVGVYTTIINVDDL